MRVIVTRPEPAGTKTARRLTELGHTAVSLPLFRAEHEPHAVSGDDAAQSGALIFTSAEALRALDKGEPDRVKALLALPVFAVGAATAAAARKLGFPTVLVSGGNGEALAGLIAESRAMLNGKPLLYLAGEPRSPGLEAGLGARGLACRVCLVYRMAPLDHDATRLRACVEQQAPTAMLLFSAEAARRITALDRQIWPGLFPAISAFLCLSPAIARALPPETVEKQHVAADPSEAALLRCLSDLHP